MKNRWLNKNLLISVVFFLLFLATVLVVEFNVIGDFDSIDVVVAADKIPKDKVIAKGDLTIQKFPVEMYRKNMITDPGKLIGKRAVQSVEESAFFTKSFIDESFLKPTKEHEFFPIPNEWIAKLQGTIRRYDLVNITAVYTGGTGIDENGLSFTSAVKQNHILKYIPVVYVKNSKNQEVSGLEKSNDRLNGKTNPAEVELSLTLKEFKELEKLYLEGYKFILSY